MSSNRSPEKGDHESSPKKPKLECAYGERCYRKNPQHFVEFAHPHLTSLLDKINNKNNKITIPPDYKPQVSYKTLVEQLGYISRSEGKKRIAEEVSKIPAESGIVGNSSGEGSRSGGSEGAGPASLPQVGSAPNDQPANAAPNDQPANAAPNNQPANPQWDAAMIKYRRDAWSRIKIPVKDKMEAAAPYNIFLTTVNDSVGTHSEPLSISFPELLDPYFGELESSLQVNFMIEFGFLLAQYNITGYKSRPLTLLYGQCDCELGDKFKHFLTHAKVVTPSSFGSHHTKLMVFRYANKSIRIVMSTANLVESDWENRTQGLWISPECPLLPPDSDTGAGESVTEFKKDFLEYLTAYRLPCLQPWLEALRQVDMSAIKVFFIGSVPGSHKSNQWGQVKLAKLLKMHVAPNNGQIIAQCSSIGSLGPQPSSWLQGEILSTLSSCKSGAGLEFNEPLKVIYPSFECISRSYDGLLGGGCLPYPQATHKKQEWLLAYLCDWYSNKRHRTRAPPHIKTYCRVSKDHQYMYYFLLTSANLSKAAWGALAKSGSLNILSYEAGILLVPQIMVSKPHFPLREEEDGVKPFSLPYDLPLVPYSYSDVPWFIDNLS